MAAITNSTNSCTSIIPEVPFPGIGATFVQEGRDWKHGDGVTAGGKSLNLISSTPDSFLEKLHIVGYPNGRIIFEVTFQETLEKAARIYFKNLQLYDDRICVARAKTSQQRSALFTILSRHNILPSEHHELIHELAYAEEWFEVTPL